MNLPSLGVTFLLAAWLMIIAIIDMRTLRIPDMLSLPLIGLGLLHAYLLSPLPLTDHLLGAAIGYAVLAAIGEAYFRWRGHEGLGRGDAKLFAAAGAWAGWLALPFVLLVASCVGLLFAIAMRKRPGAKIAFGPHLAAGFMLVWLFGVPGFGRAWVS